VWYISSYGQYDKKLRLARGEDLTILHVADAGRNVKKKNSSGRRWAPRWRESSAGTIFIQSEGQAFGASQPAQSTPRGCWAARKRQHPRQPEACAATSRWCLRNLGEDASGHRGEPHKAGGKHLRRDSEQDLLDDAARLKLSGSSAPSNRSARSWRWLNIGKLGRCCERALKLVYLPAVHLSLPRH